MASGFNSPNILFLNTYDSLDRKYMAEIVPKLIKSGYERYAELYAGGFAMPLVVASCGIKPENIYCYDISLYACILGYLFSGQNLSELKVKRDGKDVVLNGKTVYENAAILLYEQAKARIENCANNYYMELLLENMNNKEFHVKSLAERLEKMDKVLHGIHFERLYIWEALEKEKESEKTFICSNPPTYKGAYEKFFDTKGKITWAGDSFEYEIWDGSKHCKELMNRAKDIKPLVFLLQQQKPGNAATEKPIFARYLSLGQYVYYNSNRPEEVEKINGLKAATIKEHDFVKSKYPILPYDYEIKRDSKLYVYIEDTNIAEYYRRLWLHRINGKAVTFNLCVIIDGYLAGFIGLDFRPVIKPYRGTEDFVILSYATAAPNTRLRNARLLVHIARSRYILNKATGNAKSSQYSIYMPIVQRLCTVEYSRYAEVKGLRGLMKLNDRKKISDGLNALYYYCDLTDKNEVEIINDFINAEEQWMKTKK